VSAFRNVVGYQRFIGCCFHTVFEYISSAVFFLFSVKYSGIVISLIRHRHAVDYLSSECIAFYRVKQHISPLKRSTGLSVDIRIRSYRNAHFIFCFFYRAVEKIIIALHKRPRTDLKVKSFAHSFAPYVNVGVTLPRGRSFLFCFQKYSQPIHRRRVTTVSINTTSRL